MSPQLSVVLPVYNEEAPLPSVLEEWLDVFRSTVGSFRFHCLDDGSTDQSPLLLQDLARRNPEIELLRHSNRGHGQTCLAGYRAALRAEADWVFQIDSDGQCDPRCFDEFWRRREEAPLLYGHRTERADGLFRLFVSRAVSVVTLAATGVWVRDPNVPYRLMSRASLASVVPRISPRVHLVNVLLAAYHQKHFDVSWIPIGFRRRIGPPRTGRIPYLLGSGLQLYRQLLRHYPQLDRPPETRYDTLPTE